MTECASQVATAELPSVLSSTDEFPLYKVLSHCQVGLTEAGFLKLKCDSLFTGYAQWVDGEARWTLANKNDWFITQDHAEIIQNSNGTYLKSMSRDSDFVKIKGEGISLSKLREALEAVMISKQFENFKEFALTAISTTQGNRDDVVITLFFSNKSTEAEAQKVMEIYNSKVASIEKIKNLKQVSEIPRSALGKILYTKLV
jgi:O-succinylbenzoic acid--CoA ligase